jgi:hypothetical protein
MVWSIENEALQFMRPCKASGVGEEANQLIDDDSSGRPLNKKERRNYIYNEISPCIRYYTREIMYDRL